MEVSIARILGLDVGDKRIGVALSDPMGILASPLTVIERTGELEGIDKIVALVHHYEVKEIIIGLPLSLTGNVTEQAEKVHSFTRHLEQHTQVELKLRDERLSTDSARRLLREAGTKKKKEKAPDDAYAAAVILQSYLDESQ